MSKHEQFRWLRYLLLLWVGLVTFWGVLGISNGGSAVLKDTALTCIKPIVNVMTYDFLQKGAFLLLMGMHGVLLWMGLTGNISRRLYVLYFPVQGLLVLMASLLMHQLDIAFNLSLALTLGSIVMLRQTRAVMAVASGSIVLVLFCTLYFTSWYTWKSSTPELNLNTLLLNIWRTSDTMALVLFVAGYLMLYTQQVRSHAQLADTHGQLAEAHEQLKRFAQRIEELTRIGERQRLARELHDTLAQGLAGILMQIQVAHSHLEACGYERAQQIMQQTLKTSRAMLNNARRAIDDLRAPFLSSDDFIKAFHEEIHHFTLNTGIACTNEGVDILRTLPVTAYEHALRMLREALNNVTRHAQARHVWVTCEQKEHFLLLQVRDDGCGFMLTEVDVPNGHYGLLGLAERASLIGGTFEIISTPGLGTTVRFGAPLGAENERLET